MAIGMNFDDDDYPQEGIGLGSSLREALLDSFVVSTVRSNGMKQKDAMKVQRLVGSKWTNCQMIELECGDTFRMFTPSGDTYYGDDGRNSWVVKEKPYLDANNVPTVVVL